MRTEVFSSRRGVVEIEQQQLTGALRVAGGCWDDPSWWIGSFPQSQSEWENRWFPVKMFPKKEKRSIEIEIYNNLYMFGMIWPTFMAFNLWKGMRYIKNHKDQLHQQQWEGAAPETGNLWNPILEEDPKSQNHSSHMRRSANQNCPYSDIIFRLYISLYHFWFQTLPWYKSVF